MLVALIRLTMTVAALAAALTLPTYAGAQATIGGYWRQDVSRVVRQLVDSGLVPGIGVGVAVGDWVAYVDGFGTADVSSGRPATADTPFYMASTTKSLTALAAVLAANEGRLDLDAPMVRYLPAATLPEGVDRESITVRNLITLTHGLAGNGPVVLRTAYTGEFTTEQLLELLQYHAPSGELGTFSYNNLGYNLLGLVLEAVYDESWKDVVHRLVIEPLGMTATSARISSLPPDVKAMPHAWTSAGFTRAELEKEDANMHAAGGHFASTRDLTRYVAAHLADGVVEGERLLPAGVMRSTQASQAPQSRRFGLYERVGWGYGLDIALYEGDTLLSRFGSFPGYRSHVSFMPQHGIGVVVLVNGDGPAFDVADVVANYVYDRLLGRPDADSRLAAQVDSLSRQARESRRQIATHLAERRARLSPLPHALEDYAGTYESPLLGRMEWRVVAGGLEMKLGTVVHSRAEVFNATENALRVEIGGSGQVASFEFPDGSGPARAVRMAGEEFVRLPQGAR